jgi:hypothetical protein
LQAYRFAKSSSHRAQNAPFAFIVELLDLLQVSSLVVSQRCEGMHAMKMVLLAFISNEDFLIELVGIVQLILPINIVRLHAHAIAQTMNRASFDRCCWLYYLFCPAQQQS